MHQCLAYTPYYIQHSEYSEYEHGQKIKIWLRNWFYWNQHPQIIQDSLVPGFYTKYALCYLMLIKWAKWTSTQWKLFFLLKNWFPFIFHLCFMLYILVLKIRLEYFKHYIQLSQMSKMNTSRPRTQYITLKIVPLDSVPLNWGKR